MYDDYANDYLAFIDFYYDNYYDDFGFNSNSKDIKEKLRRRKNALKNKKPIKGRKIRRNGKSTGLRKSKASWVYVDEPATIIEADPDDDEYEYVYILYDYDY